MNQNSPSKVTVCLVDFSYFSSGKEIEIRVRANPEKDLMIHRLTFDSFKQNTAFALAADGV